jgi:hypothetical protein
VYANALLRISDFLSDPAPAPARENFCTPAGEMVFSSARNLAFMFVRYRFSMMLWVARLAALRPWGSCGAETGAEEEAEVLVDFSERELALRRLSVRGGLYCWGLISGPGDQQVDVDVDVLVFVLVMEARVVSFVGAVGQGMAMLMEGRALMDQDWSSLSRS